MEGGKEDGPVSSRTLLDSEQRDEFWELSPRKDMGAIPYQEEKTVNQT